MVAGPLRGESRCIITRRVDVGAPRLSGILPPPMPTAATGGRRSPGGDRRRRVLRAAVSFASLVALVGAAPRAAPIQHPPRLPDILLVCVDTLRADHLSVYGYSRPTSPVIDDLLARGTRFLEARTVEPLTGPASTSMITSRFPHEHGATRNGLRMRPGLPSLPKLLAARGYATAAFVGNWSLRDRLTGLAEHFDLYQEVFSRKRWFGLFNSEATGQDLTAEVLGWVAEHRRGTPDRPYFVWVQYVEPHAPYRYWDDLGASLGIDPSDAVSKEDRYDTEIAFTDRELGRLLRGLGGAGAPPPDTLVLFVADHGESLGGHGYWGHGNFVYDDALRIPMGIVWPGHVPAGRTISQPALIVDLAPTVLGLVGLPGREAFLGFDWAPVLAGAAEPPPRDTFFQAHRGTVQMNHTSRQARLEGLLEVGRISGRRKEVLAVRDHKLRIFDLESDSRETTDLAEPGTEPSDELLAWYEWVLEGLRASSDLPPPSLEREDMDRLRSLGYLD